MIIKKSSNEVIQLNKTRGFGCSSKFKLLKPLMVVIILAIPLIFAAGCGNSSSTDGVVTNKTADSDTVKTIVGTEVSSDDDRTLLFQDIGCGIFTPEAWNDEDYPGLIPTIDDNSFNITYMPKDFIAKYENMNPETLDDEKILEIFESAIPFMKFFYIDSKEKPDEQDKSIKAESAGFAETEKIADFNGNTYYLAYNTSCSKDDNPLYTDSIIKEFEQLATTIEDVKKNLILFPVVKQEDTLTSFATIDAKNVKDLKGDSFTAKDFGDYDMTMINLWATWCGPCVDELPDLEKVYKKLPENVNMITICIDGADENKVCLDILKKSGATFTTLASNKAMDSSILAGVTAFPTTVFVDKNGDLIGSEVVGANEAEFYLDEINSHLKLIK